MATKTISITVDAYERLKSWKDYSESFSDVILKIGRKGKLTSFAGMLTEKEGTQLESNIKRSRLLSRKRNKWIAEELK